MITNTQGRRTLEATGAVAMWKLHKLFVAMVAVVVFSDLAGAQPPRPGGGGVAPTRPVFSPYLNLTRRDAPPGVNYYGLVRPQITTQNALQSLQQQIVAVQQQPPAGQSAMNAELPITGQQTFFLNTGGYFLNNGAGFGPVNPSVMTGRPLPQVRSPSRTR